MSPKLRAVVSALGALIYAPVGLRILVWMIPSVWIAARDYTATASGGIGAASAGVDLVFGTYVVLAMGSIVASRMLASWARASGGNIRMIYRAQRWSIAFAFVVAAASVTAFTVPVGPLPFLLLPMSGVMWGVQFVLTATLLGAYAFRTSI
jgi:hypothetical protein